jgi:type I restriction enzyme S subunit
MSDWQEVELGSLTEQTRSITYGVVKPGDAPLAGGVKLVRGGDVLNGRISSELRTIAEEVSAPYRRTLLHGGELLMSLVGNPGAVAIAPPELAGANLARQVALIALRLDVDSRFVMYSLMAPSGKQSLAAMTKGSVQQVINLADLKRVRLRLPPLETQRRIASILGAYDDLIEVNRRRVAVLEEMARGLFEEWFVHFRFPGHENVPILDTADGPLPEGWARTSFGAAVENLDRKRKPLSGQERLGMQGPYPYYGAAKVFDHIDSYLFEGLHLLVAEDGSVITPDGYPVLQLVDGKFWVNNHAHVIRGKGLVSTEYLYLALLKYPIQGFITGAAQPKITQANLNRIRLIVAEDELMQRFCGMVSPLFRLLLSLQRANACLSAARDLLLPRLISGQLSVASAERELEEVA